jgi:hypothetical protein
MCIRKVTRCSFIIKAHEGHERRYLYRAEYYNPMFCFWVIMFILKSLCTMTTVTQWKVLKQGVHCILLLIDILICFGKDKLKEYAAIMGGRVLVNPLSLTLCWLGTT